MNNNVENKDSTPPRESFSELLGQIANNSATMVHDEIELVIQGIREKFRAVRSGVITVATGAVICFAAFVSLCAAMIIGLTSYMAPVFAALIIGGTLSLIGLIVVLIGYRHLKRSILKA